MENFLLRKFSTYLQYKFKIILQCFFNAINMQFCTYKYTEVNIGLTNKYTQ